MKNELKPHYQKINAQIKALSLAGREICLVAVSKTQSIEKIEALYQLGQRDFGENYVQELLEKADEMKKRGFQDVHWHFIGHLQTNKVKSLLKSSIHCIHSIDSLRLAKEVNKSLSAPLEIFIQVNVDDENTKSGVDLENLSSLIEEIQELKNLKILGLMCIPASLSGNNQGAFQKLKNLSDQLGEKTAGRLSMGMSQDFESAIKNGATHVRIGTALFGARGSVG